DELDRLGQIEWLGQVFKGATLEGRHGTVQVRVGRHDDDRQPREARLDLAQQVNARATRHANVRDQHLRLVVFKGRQHVTGIGEAAHWQVFARQSFFKHKADGLVVVN